MNRAKRLKTKGIYFLYRALQAFGLPALLLYFLARGLRQRGYWHSLPQRFGFLPRSFKQTGPGAIWLHAVSVGEVLSCVELLRRLKRELPKTRIFVSSTTLAGRATAGEKLEGLADAVFYAPVDYVSAVRRVLRTLQPSVVVVAETEIWPNFFREVKRTQAALTIVNGRISDRAFGRYLIFRRLFGAVLPCVDSVLAQSAASGERFRTLGAPAERVRVTGNFKYDFEPRPVAPGSPVAEYVAALQPGKVWIAASTMPGVDAADVDEDDAVIAAYRQVAAKYPELVLILAPRKPERFDVVAAKLADAGVQFARRTQLSGGPGVSNRVLLLDTIGELGGVFSRADVVFMGGTLARRGGHNILEPALFGKAVITGPHMDNFREIAQQFSDAGALVSIGSAAELPAAVERLLQEPDAAREIGERAMACAEARRGATGHAIDEILTLFHSHLPCYRPPTPWFQTRWALSLIWRWGARRRCDRGLMEQRKLDIPVISVGNLTMGGTGKTPCVLRLAQALKEHGRKPGILTRGYGRSSPDKHMVLAAGADIGACQSGDEPQIFVRSGIAPVGIGKDRLQTGRELRNAFDIDMMILDDGFQHLRLARDLDIVLIDALDPFGGGGVFPLGKLREPPENLARAQAIVITRSDVSENAPAVERAVRRWNADAPIFRAWVEPEAWVHHGTGRRHSVCHRPFEQAAGFCGLGNPESFRRTLEAMKIELVDWLEFDDHHRYRPNELRRIMQTFVASGAAAVVTTEKDAVNLCEGSCDLLSPLPLFWLKVGMKIEGEGELLKGVVADGIP